MKKRLVVGFVLVAMAATVGGPVLALEGAPGESIRGSVPSISSIWNGLLAAIDAVLHGDGDIGQEEEALPGESPSPSDADQASEPGEPPDPTAEMGGGTDPLG